MLLGSAHGKVTIDASGVKAGVTQATKDLKKLQAIGADVGKAMKDVGRNMTIGLTLPILALGTASLKAASDFEETKNKTMVVFGDMADSIIENSNKAARTLGINKETYMDYASSIGAALKAGGMGIQETTQLSEQAVKHFADLASFHNAQVEDVARAWESAIRGQYEPIQRYFPFITNEYLKTYGLANGMLDDNTKNLTANQRAVILNAIALDEKLNPALDDFAETSGGLANQTRIMKAQFQDALVMLGQNLLPIALDVVNGLNKLLESFNNMPPAAQKAVIGFGALLAILGPIISAIGTIITTLSSASALFGGLGISLGGVTAAASGAGGAIFAVLIPALAAIGPVILALLPAIALLYFAFKYNFGGIRTTAEQLWVVMQVGFTRMMASLKVTISQLGSIIAWGFKAGLDSIVETSRTRFSQVLEIFGKLKESIGRIFNQDWSQFGKLIIWGIVNGILGGIPWLAQAVMAIAATILNGLKAALGIHSPSSKAAYFGEMTGKGYIEGLSAALSGKQLQELLNRPAQQISQNSSNTNQALTVHLSSGLTVRQAGQMIALSREEMLKALEQGLAFG